jgi:hypothetical protein
MRRDKLTKWFKPFKSFKRFNTFKWPMRSLDALWMQSFKWTIFVRPNV